MRKIILVLIMGLFLLGCSDDKRYTDTVRSFNGPYGEGTLEGALKMHLYDCVRDKNEIEKNPPLTWVVEGKTSNGVVITPSYKNFVYRIPVIRDGDYLRTYFEWITLNGREVDITKFCPRLS